MFTILAIVMIILYVLFIGDQNSYCYDRSLYKCSNCKKNCKWRYVAKNLDK